MKLSKLDTIQQAMMQNRRKFYLTRDKTLYQIAQVRNERTAYTFEDPYGHCTRVRLELTDEEIDTLYSLV